MVKYAIIAISFQTDGLCSATFKHCEQKALGKKRRKNFPAEHAEIVVESHHHHHLFLNREGRWGTTDDFANSFLHFSLFSTALLGIPNDPRG